MACPRAEEVLGRGERETKGTNERRERKRGVLGRRGKEEERRKEENG